MIKKRDQTYRPSGEDTKRSREDEVKEDVRAGGTGRRGSVTRSGDHASSAAPDKRRGNTVALMSPAGHCGVSRLAPRHPHLSAEACL